MVKINEAMKNILVPTNFTEISSNALAYAKEFADRTKATIFLYHAYHIPVSTTDISYGTLFDEYQLIENENREALLREVARIKKKYPELHIEPILKEGFFVDSISEVIEVQKIDFVVMGTAGAEGFEEMFLGTNSGAILSKISCPLIIIPHVYQFKPVQKIVFASDYLKTDFDAINKVVEIARIFQAQLIIIHVSNHDVESRALAHQNFRSFVVQGNTKIKYNNVSYKFIENESVTNAINELVEAEGIDIIVMTTKKRNFLQKIFDPSLTKKMAYHTEIPLLTLVGKE